MEEGKRCYERRIDLLNFLRARRGTYFTKAYIGERYGVQEKVIQRDIATLLTSDINFESRPGRGGGIRYVGDKKPEYLTKEMTAAIERAIINNPSDSSILQSILEDFTYKS